MENDEELKKWQSEVYKMMESSKEIDSLRQTIRKISNESNGREEVKKMSSNVMDQGSIEDMTPESITDSIINDAMNALPKNLQETIEKQIKEFLVNKKVQVPNKK